MKICPGCKNNYPDDYQVCPRDQLALAVLSSEIVPGTVLRGKYEVLSILGSGGMATVYKVRHKAFHEIAAVKVVHTQFMYDAEFIKRFRNEAVVARQLKHPNAVRIDDFDYTDDGRPFIVMEFVDGRSLFELRKASPGPWSVERSLDIISQATEALGAAHTLGIVHRDIKPANILLLRGEENRILVKVLDFGIAKVGLANTFAGMTSVMTQQNLVIGTPEYMSPEQASGRMETTIDGRSDLYSLGLVLYEMLTGAHPFQADTPMGMLIQQVNTQPPSPGSYSTAVPPAISALVLKTLQKDPRDRFHSAGEMLAALRNPEEWYAAQQPSESMPEAPKPAAMPQPIPFSPPAPEPPPVSLSLAADPLPEPVPAKTVPVETVPEIPPDPPKPSSRRGLYLSLGIVALVVLIAAVFWGMRIFGPIPEPDNHGQTVPSGDNNAKNSSDPATPGSNPAGAHPGASDPGGASAGPSGSDASSTASDPAKPGLDLNSPGAPASGSSANPSQPSARHDKAEKSPADMAAEAAQLLGSPGNEPAAVRLLRGACQGGNADGCMNLGTLFLLGRGVTKDPSAAANHYRRACTIGKPRACSDLGQQYKSGNGVSLDLDQAAKFFTKACNGGDGFGCYELGMSDVRNGDTASATNENHKALRLLQETCDSGNLGDCRVLATLYEAKGIYPGIPRNEQKATALYRKACEMHDAAACASLKGRQ